MKTIRKGVFETNSSSTHSICVCTDEELQDWKDGKVLYDDWACIFLTKEQVIENVLKNNPGMTEEEALEYMQEEPYDFPTSYDEWGKDYEHDHNIFTTKSGDKINILCYYGYDY